MDQTNIRTFIQNNLLSLVILIFGLILLTIGIITATYQTKGEEVVITNSQPASLSTPYVNATVFIDLQGAVEKPGVYELNADQRVIDALVAAGGLSVTADRGWVTKNLNQAQRLTDGQKIYIPPQIEISSANSAPSVQGITTQMISPNSLVSINTASLNELDALWGIGAARAKAIIDNRPYGLIDELKTKAGIPQNVIDKNQGKWGL